MIRPSAPAATAARAIGATMSRRPAPWLGSATIGRWLSFLTTGIAEMSNVLRVAVSNVRMPRSQRMTSLLPPLSTYSADSSHSSIVAEMPRLISTGLRACPSSRSSVKFCMLRAPTWKMSVYLSMTSIWLRSITSVMSFRFSAFAPRRAAGAALPRPAPGSCTASCAA